MTEGDFPTHAAASEIARVAKSLGFRVSRSAASPSSRSAYVFVNGIKIRVADHPPSHRDRAVVLDVYADNYPRPRAVSLPQAIQWLLDHQPGRNRP